MQLQPIRSLTFDTRRPDTPTHLAAASGLVRLGDTLCVVADDDLHLGLFPQHPKSHAYAMRLLPGGLPEDPRALKAQKPDFEVLVRLPPFEGYEAGALLALGSGSTPRRSRAVLLALTEDETLSAMTELVDFAPIYQSLAPIFPELNIEGAAVLGDRLILLQRGNGSRGQNALISLELKAVLAALGRGDHLPGQCVLTTTAVSLGSDGGWTLGFTDAAALPDGNLLYSAVAEETPDTYQDGPCRAAVLGVITPEGKVLRQEELQPTVKIEGITLADAAAHELFLVADPDDRSQPATLYRARWR